MASSFVIRESRYIWYLRIVQVITSLVALGVASQNATGWDAIECSIPSNFSFNLAVAIITLPTLAYLFFSTGRFASTGFWWFWAQIGVDAFFIIMWIAAAATSAINCNDICSACTAAGIDGMEFDVYSSPNDGLTYDWICHCVDYVDSSADKRSLVATVFKRWLFPRNGSGGKVALTMASVAVKQGFQGLMIFCFFSALISALGIRFGWWRSRNQNANQATSEMNDWPQKEEVNAAAHFANNLG